MITEAAAAYAAGLFDGEGHVSMRIVKNRGRSRGHSFTVSVRLLMCDREPLDTLQASFGGVVRKKCLTPKGRPVYNLDWSRNEQEHFVKAILPYATGKRQQLELYLAGRALIRGSFARVTEEEWQQRDGLCNALLACRAVPT